MCHTIVGLCFVLPMKKAADAKEARHTAFGISNSVEHAVVLCQQLIKLCSGNLSGRDHLGRLRRGCMQARAPEVRCRTDVAPAERRGAGKKGDENAQLRSDERMFAESKSMASSSSLQTEVGRDCMRARASASASEGHEP